MLLAASTLVATRPKTTDSQISAIASTSSRPRAASRRSGLAAE